MENQETVATPQAEVLVTDKNYYDDRTHVTFSALKVFSKCETLYREIFIDKTYEQPDKDYFVYGKLVDALITETPEVIKNDFVVVSSKVKVEDALKYENSKQELLNEIEVVKKKDQDKIDKLSAKMIELNEKETTTDKQKLAKDAKLLKLDGEIDELKKNPSSMVIKGVESRQTKIDELDQKLLAIKEMGNKLQVTRSIWKNAEETALALKTHPYYTNLEFDEFTSQQILTTEIDGIKMKGKLDHLKLAPEVEKVYKMFKAKLIDLTEMQNTINALPVESRWAIITDIKSCFNIEKLEPYNNHYRGQLGFYQDLVSSMFCIPVNQIVCQIFVGDKVASEFKRAEIFKYTQSAIEELKGDVKAWVGIWKQAHDSNKYRSAKSKYGMKQQCFTCSECRMAPFAQEPGVPVLIDGPRFDVPDTAGADLTDLLIDY